jgi:hypothetical protein
MVEVNKRVRVCPRPRMTQIVTQEASRRKRTVAVNIGTAATHASTFPPHFASTLP